MRPLERRVGERLSDAELDARLLAELGAMMRDRPDTCPDDAGDAVLAFLAADDVGAEILAFLGADDFAL